MNDASASRWSVLWSYVQSRLANAWAKCQVHLVSALRPTKVRKLSQDICEPRTSNRYCTVPDFGVRTAACFLRSNEIASLLQVDHVSKSALELPGFISELVKLRRFKHVTLLPQLHLAECMDQIDNVIGFDFMSVRLTVDGRVTLSQIAELMLRHPGTTAQVEAHSQPGAPPAVARELSQARAQIIIATLERAGVDRNRLQGTAYANNRPLRVSPFGAANRRVEIFLELHDAQFPAERLPYNEVHVRDDPGVLTETDVLEMSADESDDAESAAMEVLAEAQLMREITNTSSSSDSGSDSSSDSMQGVLGIAGDGL